MDISPYLNLERIVFIEAHDRDDALLQLAEVAKNEFETSHFDQFYNAILERERIDSTGIGMGVAIPHAKLEELNHFFVTIGILKFPLEWNSIDASPVKVVILIGGPTNRPTEYLQILSLLTRAIRNEELRKKLFNSINSSDIIELFNSI